WLWIPGSLALLGPRNDARSRGLTFRFPPARSQPLAHVFGHRRDDADRVAIFVKRHYDLARLQMQDRTAGSRRTAVDRIAEDWPAHLGAMHAKLMRTSGQRFEREPGQRGGRAARVAASAHHPPLCHRRLAVRIVFHPPAARDVETAERQERRRARLGLPVDLARAR